MKTIQKEVRHHSEEKPHTAPLETRRLSASPAKSEQNQVKEDREARLGPAAEIDESALDEDVLADLDDLESVLEANAQFMGKVAVSVERDAIDRAWEAWRNVCLGETALLAA